MGKSSVILELKNITKSYKEGLNNYLTIIDNSSLVIEQNQIIFFIGSSGCGKSSLLQICGLLDKQSSGDILINGVSTYNLNEKQKTEIRKNNIGFIYQAHHLFPEFTAIENVMLPLLVKSYNKKLAYQEAKNILIELGLETKINNFPSELSGGEKQRVAIARAIITKPQIILADEPTGNLDFDNATNVLEILINTVKKYNLSLLLVTHDMNLTKFADKIITIKDKKIINYS